MPLTSADPADTPSPTRGAPRQGRRKPFTQQAYEQIKRRVLANELPPGTQVLEQQLADDLGMSRTPVREAAMRLAREGLVEVRPRHGIRILPISAGDMREIYEILTALESAAAETCARRGLTDGEMERLTDAVEAMDRALAVDDLDAWADADETFHRALTDLGGNRRLQALVNTIWDQAHRARMVTLRLRPKPVGSNDAHRALIAAIIAGDTDAARRVHRQHRQESGDLLVEILNRSGLSQL